MRNSTLPVPKVLAGNRGTSPRSPPDSQPRDLSVTPGILRLGAPCSQGCPAWGMRWGPRDLRAHRQGSFWSIGFLQKFGIDLHKSIRKTYNVMKTLSLLGIATDFSAQSPPEGDELKAAPRVAFLSLTLLQSEDDNSACTLGPPLRAYATP